LKVSKPSDENSQSCLPKNIENLTGTRSWNFGIELFKCIFPRRCLRGWRRVVLVRRNPFSDIQLSIVEKKYHGPRWRLPATRRLSLDRGSSPRRWPYYYARIFFTRSRLRATRRLSFDRGSSPRRTTLNGFGVREKMKLDFNPANSQNLSSWVRHRFFRKMF